jgi:hypothetical protein
VIVLGGTVSVLVALAAGAASATAVIGSRRGVMIVALLIQFVCAALLFSSLPRALVLAYCIVGACVCGILAVTPATPYGVGEAPHAGIPSGMWFRVVAVLLVALASISLARAVIGAAVAPGVPVGAGLLVGLGLLQVGLSEEPLRVGFGLMSIISGFEIAYTTVETAIALHGLVIGVPLLIALVVAYLQVQQTGGSDTVR